MKQSEEATASLAAAILADAAAKYIQLFSREKDTKELEEFFTGSWANELSLGNGKRVWERVKQTAIEEKKRVEQKSGHTKYFRPRRGF